MVGPIRELWACGRERCRDAIDRVHPAVLLGGGLAAVLLVFGTLSVVILATGRGVGDLGLRPPEAGADSGNGSAPSDGDPGADELTSGLAAGISSSDTTTGRVRQDGPDGDDVGDGDEPGDGEAAGEGPALTGATTGPATSSPGATPRASSIGGDGSAPTGPGSTTTTAGSSAPGTSQPPTTAPPTTAPDDDSGGRGLLGGLLDLLGLGVILPLR